VAVDAPRRAAAVATPCRRTPAVRSTVARLRGSRAGSFILWGLAVTALAPAASAAIADPAGESKWAAHGFSTAQRAQLREAWQWGIEHHFVPGGAMLVVHRGEVIFREAFGVADLETKHPFPVDAPCRLASVTKPYTATLLAMLVEQGKVGWDDAVDKFLPQMARLNVRGSGPAARPPKIRELLSHTAGFPGNSERRSGASGVRLGETLAQAVDEIARAGLVTEPGTAYAYTGMGYMVAGRVAEVVTGREFAALMQEKLLAPLGATGAVFLPSASAALKARMPTRYERIDGKLKRADESGADEAGVGFPNPGGGLVATVDEVAKFLLLHRNHGLVDGVHLVAPESLRALYRPQPATGREGYGFGFNILRTDVSGVGDRVRHNGASGTSMLIDFKADLLVVVLTQVPTKQRLPFGNRLNQVVDSIFSVP
jgi:CubicO group peptidase (beta-lactamase class C family)